MTTLLEAVRHAADRFAEVCAPESLLVRGYWMQEYVLQLTSVSTVLSLRFVLVQTANQGCCYVEGVPVDGVGTEVLGLNALDVRTCRAVEIACLDSILAGAPVSPREEVVLRGRPGDKAMQRAQVMAGCVERLLRKRVPKGSGGFRVVNVGVVGEFISALSNLEGVSVRATDFAPLIADSAVHGVQVASGTHTLEEIALADVAVVTGMTMWNGTLDEIVRTATREGTSLVVFAETGASFAPIYCGHGIDIVMSEPYPFYLCGPGESVLRIFSSARVK